MTTRPLGYVVVKGAQRRRGRAGHPDAYCLCGHPNYLTCAKHALPVRPRQAGELLGVTLQATP